MKKIALLIALVSVFTTTAMAQDSQVEAVFKKYRFGLYVGPTFNSLKPTADVVKDNNGDYSVVKGDGRVGFSAGLNVEFNFNEKYTVYSGIGLDWNGGTITATYDSTSGTALDSKYAKEATVDYRNQYLSVPLGLKMYAAEFGDIKVFAQTGIDLSLLLSQKGDYKIMPNSGAEISATNVKLNDFAQVTPINLGWHIGAGAEYTLSNGSAAYAAVIYRNGFTDYTTPKSNTSGLRFADGNIRSNTIAVRIGYFF